jgi:Zn-dependent protease
MLLSNPLQFIINAIYLVPALVIGIVGHELAHAAVAVSRGDQTPKIDGRLSLNPQNHLDPLGTLAVFFIYFGWAKPLRLNPFRMLNALDPVLVWIAGPLASFLIALALSIPLRLALNASLPALASPLLQLLLVIFYFNVLLAVINLIPIPGLDGYNLLAALFRRRFGRIFHRLESSRQVILLIAVGILIFAPFLLGQSIFNYFYSPIAAWLLGTSVRPAGF